MFLEALPTLELLENLSNISEVIREPESTVKMGYCNTDCQLADIFAKALPVHKWLNTLQLLGVETRNLPEMEWLIAEGAVSDPAQ